MKKAFFSIDFIKGIISGNGSCAQYSMEHPEIINHVNDLIDVAHRNKIPVFHICLGFDETYQSLPKYALTASAIKINQYFKCGDASTELIDELHRSAEDRIIYKAYGDIFYGNNLLSTLKDLKVEELIFTGYSTDNAILNSANTAMVNNFYVTVVEDACGARNESEHQWALNIMKGRTVSEVITTQEAIQKLSK